LSLAWRYFGSVTLDAADSNLLLEGPYDSVIKKLDAQDYIDVAANWQVMEKFSVNVGINNVLDKSPPIAGSSVAGPPYGNGNTYPQVYDPLGRYVFMGVTAKF
jgi:outer membrane receptor protein involved in Fe transport